MAQQETAIASHAWLWAANCPSAFQRIGQRQVLNQAAQVIVALFFIASCVGQRCENDDLIARTRDCASIMSSERVIRDLFVCADQIRDLVYKDWIDSKKIFNTRHERLPTYLIRIIIRSWFLS
jgi:hypothetical protein